MLHAGDIYNAGAVQYGEDYLHSRPWVAAQSVPVLAVRGNHDFRDPDGFFKVAEDISGCLSRLADGLWVAGVDFAPEWYCDTPGESDLEPQSATLNCECVRNSHRR
ncbi:MAG: metallophosphoesterase [Phycisphaerae bacterium]